MTKQKQCPHYNEYEWGEPPLDEESNGRLVKEFECNLAKHYFTAHCDGNMQNCNLIPELYKFLTNHQDEIDKIKNENARLREEIGSYTILKPVMRKKEADDCIAELRSENDRLREVVEAWGNAVKKVRSWYPEDVFIPWR